MDAVADVVVELINEPTYSFGSVDNTRTYVTETMLHPESSIWSVHGLIVDGIPVVVVGASGGPTGVHEHSLLRLGHVVYFAVGPNVCRLTLGSRCLDWSLEVDDATCFGVHYSAQHDALISHGELAISRFTPDGKVVWKAEGADIFTEGFSLREDCIEAVDFYNRVYRFDYATGRRITPEA